jgi:hypothetical protein
MQIKSWIILLVLSLVAVACAPVGTANMDQLNRNLGDIEKEVIPDVITRVTKTDQLNDSLETAAKVDEVLKQPNNGAYCNGSTEKHHPVAEKLSIAYDVTYEEIIGWFCKGYGFGEIDRAYRISRDATVPVEEVFARRESGLGWGEIMKDYGVSVKPNNGAGNGKGNGNGIGKGKGKGKNK